MEEKQHNPSKTKPTVKRPPQSKPPRVESPYDFREAPVYRDHDDFREWLMRDSR